MLSALPFIFDFKIEVHQSSAEQSVVLVISLFVFLIMAGLGRSGLQKATEVINSTTTTLF